MLRTSAVNSVLLWLAELAELAELLELRASVLPSKANFIVGLLHNRLPMCCFFWGDVADAAERSSPSATKERNDASKD